MLNQELITLHYQLRKEVVAMVDAYIATRAYPEAYQRVFELLDRLTQDQVELLLMSSDFIGSFADVLMYLPEDTDEYEQQLFETELNDFVSYVASECERFS